MRLSALALCVAVAATPLAAETAELAGHRAGYKLSLETARGNVIGAQGVMTYEVIDACDAWAVHQRLALTITGRDGNDVNLASEYTTWESKDGRQLRFRMRQTTEDAVAVDIIGTAELEKPGGKGMATYTQPLDTTQELPVGTLFPMAHTGAILEAARSGKRFIALPLFDGTSADGAQDSTVAITGWKPPAAAARPALAQLPSTRVRIAFFAREGMNQQPEYEVGMRYWENGVADELSMDFGDYVLSGKLSELTVSKPAC